MSLRYHLAVCAYCISCSTMHHMLTVHYVDQCNAWLSFAETGYCGLVRKALGLLRTSPLLIAGAVIANAPIAHRPLSDT